MQSYCRSVANLSGAYSAFSERTATIRATMITTKSANPSETNVWSKRAHLIVVAISAGGCFSNVFTIFATAESSYNCIKPFTTCREGARNNLAQPHELSVMLSYRSNRRLLSKIFFPVYYFSRNAMLNPAIMSRSKSKF